MMSGVQQLSRPMAYQQLSQACQLFPEVVDVGLRDGRGFDKVDLVCDLLRERRLQRLSEVAVRFNHGMQRTEREGGGHDEEYE